MAIDVNRSQRARLGAEPTTLDLQLLSASMNGAEIVFDAEQFDADGDTHLDNVIDKPWGLEYRVYADMFFDAWALRLLPGHSTSTHCHPRKDTALLCLARSGTTHFLDEAHSRLRRTSLTGEYRFDIERGDAIARRADPWTLFAVSLALHHAVSSEISVVGLARPEAEVLDPDVTYFTISRRS